MLLLAPISEKPKYSTSEFESAIAEYKDSIADYKQHSHCAYFYHGGGDIGDIVPARKIERAEILRLINVFQELRKKNEISERTLRIVTKAALSVYLEHLFNRKFN